MAESFRSVMEVLKWTDPRTVLVSAAKVSAFWARVANSDELWNSHIEAEGLEELVDTRLVFSKVQFREAGLTISKGSDLRIDRFILSLNSTVARVFQYTTDSFLKKIPFPLPRLGPFCAIAVLSNKEVFVCGGGNNHAHRISMASGAMTWLPCMRESRNYHSALLCYRRVYVFGSLPATNTAECYGLSERKWWQLPDMLTARGAFNACNRAKRIFLCGGNTTNCEVFDIATMQYTSLAFPLPGRNWTVSFFYQDQLVAIVKDCEYFCEDEGWREVKIQTSNKPLGSSAAVVYGHSVYIPMNSCSKILKIDMNTRTCVDLF